MQRASSTQYTRRLQNLSPVFRDTIMASIATQMYTKKRDDKSVAMEASRV